MCRQPGSGIDRRAPVPQLEVETGGLVPLGGNFANGLTGNYARASADVKPREAGQQRMISASPIDDQEQPEAAERAREGDGAGGGGADCLRDRREDGESRVVQPG